ncbi:hypothetical protein [Streptomyces sp. PTD5-9]|uniref:hypothetical protein n=1 Tax=Streptomyces sp. PTD5-9 TaxID=3120150 RepID=UPI00300A7D8E
MGTDISGFVECRAWRLHEGGEDTVWRAAIDLFLLNTTRNYDAFGCLFGVRNYANFRPLAEERGLPPDASDAVRTELARRSDQVFGTTWITWAELKTTDWTEMAEAADSRLHQYRQTADGLEFVGKFAWSRRFAEAIGVLERVPGQAQAWPEGGEWRIGDSIYRSERISRRDAVQDDGEWKPVWTVMEALASQHGDDNVRLVVWFDN